MPESFPKRLRAFFWKRKFILAPLLIISAGYCWPERYVFPVKNGCKKDYSQNSFWYFPWGRSGTHKGADIFAKRGTEALSATNGFVLFTGEIAMGGKVVFVLGPKWRLHYYAHLNEINVSSFSFVDAGDLIGKVGSSGNAAGKAPHLHYSINTLIPQPWQIDMGHQGWKKMFYINPVPLLNEVAR